MKLKRYAKHVSIFLGLSVVLALIVFILVAHHRDIPDRVRQDRSVLLGASSSSSVAERIKPVGQVNIALAEPRREPAQAMVAASQPPVPRRNGEQVYQTACLACHDAGIAGAPKLGDKDHWAKRIAKGMDSLYASAVNGTQGSAGVMPPKGGNSALSNAEVKAAVDYIVAQSK
jgi:cytochrome c5